MKYMRLRFASLLFIGPLFSENTYSLTSALGDANDLNEDIKANYRTLADIEHISVLDAALKHEQSTKIPAFTTEYGTIKQQSDD